MQQHCRWPFNLIKQHFDRTKIFVRNGQITITKQNKQYVETNTFITQVVVAKHALYLEKHIEKR